MHSLARVKVEATDSVHFVREFTSQVYVLHRRRKIDVRKTTSIPTRNLDLRMSSLRNEMTIRNEHSRRDRSSNSRGRGDRP